MSSTISSPSDVTTQTQTQTHANQIHAASTATATADDKVQNAPEREPQQQQQQQQRQPTIQKITPLSMINNTTVSSGTTCTNVNEIHSMNKDEENCSDADKILQAKNLGNGNKIGESLVSESNHNHNHHHDEKDIAWNKKMLQPQSSVSPTTTMETSSSLSLQESSPTLKPLPTMKHGFGINLAPVPAPAPAQRSPQSQNLISNTNITTTIKGANGDGTTSVSARADDRNKKNNVSTVVKEGPKNQQSSKSPSGPATNNVQKEKKARSRSVGGRPRSNSVPFDFHSAVVKPQPKSTSPNSKSGNLRRGKWTVEEEAYVARVIQDFNSGYLNAPPGTTLRTYLSDKLNCDPMRITKKFTGDACIGKRVFHPAVRCSNNAALIDKAQSELDTLERRWRKRLEMQQREAAKKQAASAAAAAAAVSGRMLQGKNLPNSLGTNGSRAVVAQTASWLDRANAILSQTHIPARSEQENKIVKTSSDEVEKEMKEVERLIHEGPIIQKTSAGLPTLLEKSMSNDALIKPTQSNDGPNKRKVTDVMPTKGVNTPIQFNDHLKNVSPSDNNASRFNDKRMRRSFSYNNVQDHEDAATLMGFLSSVRQAAASSASSSK